MYESVTQSGMASYTVIDVVCVLQIAPQMLLV